MAFKTGKTRAHRVKFAVHFRLPVKQFVVHCFVLGVRLGLSQTITTTKISCSEAQAIMGAKAWVKFKSSSPLCSRSLRGALKNHLIVTLNTRNNATEFIIEFGSDEDAAKALELSAVGDVKIESETQLPTLSTGTISSWELAKWKVEELSDNQVSGVTRMASEGRVEGSGRFKSNFTCKNPPSEVRFDCGLSLRVKPFIPAPLRCRKCLVYRHHDDSCSKPRKCTNCGLTGHLSNVCQRPPCCAAPRSNRPVLSYIYP